MGLSLLSVPSDRVSATAEPPLSFFITPTESGMPAVGTAVAKKVAKLEALINGIFIVRLFVTLFGTVNTASLNSLKPPSVQAFDPLTAGMTSWACTGHARTASSRRGASLARGGGYGNVSSWFSPNLNDTQALYHIPCRCISVSPVSS